MARQFAGTPDELHATVAAVTGYPFTLAIGFNVPTLGNQTLMALGNSTDDAQRFRLRALTAGTVEIVTDAVTGSSSVTAGTFTAGSWHHAAAVCISATSRTAYLDGAGAATTDNTNLTPTGLDRTSIAARVGATTTGYGVYTGADAAIWNAALTLNEIAQLVRGASPEKVRPESLVLYLPLGGRDEAYKGLVFTIAGGQSRPSPEMVRRPIRRL